MRHLIGIDDHHWSRDRNTVPYVLDTTTLTNANMLIAGMSGTGKSTQVTGLLASAGKAGIEADIFDAHEEFHTLPGASTATFSAATHYGYNPLTLSTDPHSGGVYRGIDDFVGLINRQSRELGPRQESALRHLLKDVYTLRGIDPSDPRSWYRREITESQWERMIASRDYNGLRDYYPTLRDLLSYTERKLKAMSTGSNSKSVNALEKVEKLTSRINTLQTKFGKASTDSEIESLNKQLEEAKAKAIEAYCEHINGIETGREFADHIKYTSKDTILSLKERIEMLFEQGTFRSNPPPFDGTLRVHNIKHLRDDVRLMYVHERLNAILHRATAAGFADHVRHLVLLDEGHLYYSEDKDHPINRIAKEGRKFGLGLIIASQSPSHFSEDFLTNCGTIILTGIHTNYWTEASRKLRIDKTVLEAVRATETIALKLQKKGDPNPKFVNINVQRDLVRSCIEAYLNKARQPA